MFYLCTVKSSRSQVDANHWYSFVFVRHYMCICIQIYIDICICAFFVVIGIDCLVDSVNIYVCNNTFSYIAVHILLARLNANLTQTLKEENL